MLPDNEAGAFHVTVSSVLLSLLKCVNAYIKQTISLRIQLIPSEQNQISRLTWPVQVFFVTGSLDKSESKVPKNCPIVPSSLSVAIIKNPLNIRFPVRETAIATEKLNRAIRCHNYI